MPDPWKWTFTLVMGCGLTLMLISLIMAAPHLWPWQIGLVGYAYLAGALIARRPQED